MHAFKMNGTKKNESRLRRFWKLLGPGLITGASDDDPSGIATYSQAGAGYGLSFLWTAIITYPLMAAIQEMCARIGMVTSKGLAGNLKTYYPKFIIYLMVLFSFPAIVMNIGADIAAMGAVENLLMPKMPAALFSIFFTVLMMFMIVLLPYRKIFSVLKYLCCILLVYLIVPFLCKQDWGGIFRGSFLSKFKSNKGFMEILVAIFGTTISPYLFFWQASMEVEQRQHQTLIVLDKRLLRDMKRDVDFGMMFSNFIMFFIILTTGTVLFRGDIHEIETVEQAAIALKPLAGNLSYVLFSVGVIGTGFLAIPVLSGSLSYIVTEAFGWQNGLDKKSFMKPKLFISSLPFLLE